MLGLERQLEKQQIRGFFNFSGEDKRIFLEPGTRWANLLTGEELEGENLLENHGFYWLKLLQRGEKQ